MKINPHIFRAYDIRGIAQPIDKYQQVDLNPEISEIIGKAAGTYLQKISGKNIVVAMDNRTHSPALQKAFIEGLLSTGCNVTDIGIATSPMLYYATCRYSFDGGVAITASHNPKEYNGVKVVQKGAHSVCGDELQEILKIAQSGEFAEGSGKLVEKEIFEDYKNDIVGKMKMGKPLKVVVDAANGTTSIFGPELIRALGCEVTELYCEYDGNYPNHPGDPEKIENMRDLMAKVKEVGADIGIGFDGDGDRVGVIDEKGQFYSADFLIMLLARDVLSRHPGEKIVFDVKVSKVLIDDIKKHGGEPVMSKTGHSFIESKMKEIGALLGGELSGHLFFAEDYYGFDDAMFGAAKILEIISNFDKPFSEQFEGVPRLQSTPELKISVDDEKKFKICEQVAEYLDNNYDCITIDGARCNFDQSTWALIRCSNTSPNITMRFESDSEENLHKAQKIMVEKILEIQPGLAIDWYKP